MAVRVYFDGGNQHDTLGELTLAAIVGTDIQWRNLEESWTANLRNHHAPFVHTTDAVSLNNEFSQDKGWSKNRTRELLRDSVTIINRCLAEPLKHNFDGILPLTTTVNMRDFKRAKQKVPDLGTPEAICVISTLDMCFQHGSRHLDIHRFKLIFDQNEKFYGHIRDRKDNRKSRATDRIWSNVDALTEADMRRVPGLQVADLFAWSVNSKYKHGGTHHNWQKELLARHGEDHRLTYEQLLKPNFEVIERVKSWKLPPRRRTQ